MAHRAFSAFFVFTFCSVAGQSIEYALMQLAVNLKPAITGQPDEILWKHNGNKVVEFNGNEQQAYGQFKNRITLDWFSAELDITDLGFEDSGEYELEVYINNILHLSRFQLEVIDKVAKPRIICEMNDRSSADISGIQATLVCSADPGRHQSLTNIEWTSHGNVQPGPNLTISLGDKHDDEVYSCNVSNPLTHETATFTAKDCYPEQSSSVLIASLVSIFLSILLLVALGIVFCRLRQKACFAERKTEELEKQQSLPRLTEGLDEATQDDENSRLLHREATYPSTQQLPSSEQMSVSESEKEADEDEDAESLLANGVSPPTAKPRLSLTQNSPNMAPKDTAGEHKQDANSDPVIGETADFRESESEDSGRENQSASVPEQKGNENKSLGLQQKGGAHPLREAAEEKVPLCDPSDSEKANELDPAGVLGDLSRNTQSDLESSTAPEQPESEKEADEDEDAESLLANGVSPPTAKPRLSLTQNSPNMAPKDTAGEHKQDANSDQVIGETADFRESESEDSGRENQSASVPEQKGLKNKSLGLEQKGGAHPLREAAEEKVPLCNPSDSEKANELDSAGVLGDLSRNTQSDLESSTAPEQPAYDRDCEEGTLRKGYVQRMSKNFDKAGKSPQQITQTGHF